MNDTSHSELERQCQIDDARLGVAEELGWGTATFAGIAAWLYWQSFFLALGIAVVVYVLAISRYNKASKASWDAYEKATKTGKYLHE